VLEGILDLNAKSAGGGHNSIFAFSSLQHRASISDCQRVVLTFIYVYIYE
jgi:hypothetical protein